jgi:ornithine--oxo-acid transaminase
LGGGALPVSAVCASSEILSVYQPGDHGSTFGGNPLACAVARAAIKVLKEERLVERSAQMGEYLMNKLRALKSGYIKDIRGRGLLVGIELHASAGGARRFCEDLMRRGMLCKETHENVIRLAPPLVITEKEIDWAFSRLKKVLGT